MTPAPLPPESVVTALRTYDRTLRLRWGRHSELWFVEEPLPLRHPGLLKERKPPKAKKSLDKWEGLQDGWSVVLIVHPTLLRANVVLEGLRRADLQANDGAAGLNRLYDRLDEEDEKGTDRLVHNFHEDFAKEWWDRQLWDDKRAISLYVPPSEGSEGFTVTDRRRVSV